jgi:hypothetical protein
MPMEAELLACWEGLNLAMQWIDKPIILESVCNALKAMMENSVTPCVTESLIIFFKFLIKH